MAHQHFIPDIQNLKPSFPLSEIDPNMEILMTQIPDFNPGAAVDTSNLNLQALMGISQDNNYFLQLQDHQFPGNLLAENFPAVFSNDLKNAPSISEEPVCCSPNNDHGWNKRKQITQTPESSSANSSEIGIRRKNQNTGKGKRAKSNEKEEDKPKVVHVRAKRGQATDSHSLAERVRRGKINERLKCLQDIVPGCHKTMGMAVMLDEIINYVQSLQNQVEFLSMKLTAASNMYNFNGATDTIDTIQRAKAFEAMKLHRHLKEECDGLASTQLEHFDLTFGCYPSLPYHT